MFVFRLQRRTYSRISTRSSPAANADRFKIPLLKPHPLRLAAQRKTVTTEGQSGESCSRAISPTHCVVNPTLDYSSWAVPQGANWTGTGGKRECPRNPEGTFHTGGYFTREFRRPRNL
jgi:hypothetical protein